MSRLHAIQPVTEQPHDGDQVAQGPREVHSPWLSAKEAAAYLRCPTVAAFYIWRRRHGIEARHRGKCLLFARLDLDRAIGVVARRRS